MKIYEWNIGMAATFGCNNGYPLLPWIIDEITMDNPELFVLTEFVVSRGWDNIQEKLEIKGYKWFVSGTSGQNGILIALKDGGNFDLSDVFGYKDKVVNNCAILKTTCPPDFYEVRFRIGGQSFSLIGLRIRVGGKQQQFDALDAYLASLEEIGIKVLCIGDFNAYWSNGWDDSKLNTTLPRASKKFKLHTPPYGKGDWFSYVNPKAKNYGGKQQLDHFISNINAEITNCEYDWKFIENHVNEYGSVTKATPEKINGMPDHAIFKVEFVLLLANS